MLAKTFQQAGGIVKAWLGQHSCAIAGLILWAYTPHVDREMFKECRNCFAIQVTPTDHVFQDIVRPVAEAAQAANRAAEPVKGCSPGVC